MADVGVKADVGVAKKRVADVGVKADVVVAEVRVKADVGVAKVGVADKPRVKADVVDGDDMPPIKLPVLHLALRKNPLDLTGRPSLGYAAARARAQTQTHSESCSKCSKCSKRASGRFQACKDGCL